MTYLELKQDTDIQELLEQLPEEKRDLMFHYRGSIYARSTDKKEFILASLRALLDEYTATKPTTKGGKIARFIAKIASLVSRVVKI